MLSPTTADYDAGRKFRLYRNLPSLEEYVLVAQDEVHVEVFRRCDDGRWTLSVYEALDRPVPMESLG